ncbi:cilia- and flagella- associated protein 210 isoform X1 [Maylandia zebra]|uniref:cilia- and flagella- associated protein 210 isoform X1 n=1 Tax=Maylandia zebra TaxID=106582 RepID=UPI0006CF1368|nr:coiled-coil domain-containing protein 173 isoform X1 [Maylandia zebra]
MAAVVLYGRRRGASKNADEAIRAMQPPDLRHVTVLRKTEWLRIQDELCGVNKEEKRIREAAKQRENLHLQSQEVVKLWPDTLHGQRLKRLQEKKIRKEIEEEQMRLADLEEAKYQEQRRKEIIEKAKTQLYCQTDRVKGLHSALLLTEVLKERDAQIELKQRRKSANIDVDKAFLHMVQTREDEASKQEQEKAMQRKLVRQVAAEDLRNQIKENELLRERQKLESKKDGDEIQRLQALHQLERRMEAERQANQKRSLMQARQEHITNRDLVRATDAQKREAEEEQRKLFLSTKQKIIKLRKEKEKELLREAQTRRDRIINKLTVTQQEQAVSEEQKIAKAVAESEAKQAQQQLEEDEKKAAMLKSISVHRELMRQEKEEKDKIERKKAQEALQAKKEADRIFTEKQQLKVKKIREEEREVQDFNAAQMAEKGARLQQLRQQEHEFEVKNAELIAEEENRFQQYSQQIINAAAEAQRNVFPLCKAAREGIGGGSGPVFSGVRPSYLVQDRTGAQMPKYVSLATQNIKKLHQAVDIQDAKRRLGFTW